ncbi:MAG: hypothetical protein AB7O67_10285 [Vicinamibacterales bacterium]
MHVRHLLLLVALVLATADLAVQDRVLRVSAGDDLQAALDAARPGDTILVEAGATFSGNFVLPAKDGDAWITVSSSASSDGIPTEGRRIRPADAARLARLRSPNDEPALRTAPGAHHWRLRLLELGPTAGGGDVVAFGEGQRQRAADVPHDLEIDRCYIHGAPERGQRRGVALNSASTTIRNSYIADIKSDGVDSQAIGGWNGPGPFDIVNNYLEAAGENVMFGGGDPSIRGLVPSDIRVIGNHLAKPVAWRGGPWDVKNLFELKNARRVRIEGNLFEHNWQAAQPGPAIVFTPRNQEGGAPWSGIEDVVFQGNVVRHVAAAFNILGHDDNAPSRQTRQVTIANNVLYDVDAAAWGGNGVFLLIGDGATDIHVERNTVVHSGNVISAYGRPTTGFVFRDNLVRHNRYGIKGDGAGVGDDTIATYFPGGEVSGNVFAGGPAGRYPGDNQFPADARWASWFAGAHDLPVLSAEAQRRAAADAAGANVAAVLDAARRALAGTARANVR